MDVERVSLSVETTAPGGTVNAFVIGREPAVLVDPARRSNALTRAVRARDVGHIAVTHTHPDHVGAVESYAADTDATVWARYGRTDRFERATGRSPDRTFREGTTLGPLRVLETPGHAPDHVAFEWGDEALVGDLAMREGSVFVGGVDGDMRAYLTSLRRLLSGGYRRLAPGHGPPITDPDAVLIRLIRHRIDRERRVLAAVMSGATAVDSIVDAAYDRELGDLERLARLAVEAHLEKLDTEGTVRWNGEHASPIG